MFHVRLFSSCWTCCTTRASVQKDHGGDPNKSGAFGCHGLLSTPGAGNVPRNPKSFTHCLKKPALGAKWKYLRVRSDTVGTFSAIKLGFFLDSLHVFWNFHGVDPYPFS